MSIFGFKTLTSLCKWDRAESRDLARKVQATRETAVILALISRRWVYSSRGWP